MREASTISTQNGQGLSLSTFSAVRLQVNCKESFSHILGYPALFFLCDVVLGSDLPCNRVQPSCWYSPTSPGCAPPRWDGLLERRNAMIGSIIYQVKTEINRSCEIKSSTQSLPRCLQSRKSLCRRPLDPNVCSVRIFICLYSEYIRL